MNLGQLKRQIEQAEAQRAPRAPYMSDAELARRTRETLDWAEQHRDDNFAPRFATALINWLKEHQTKLNPPAGPELQALFRERLLPRDFVGDLI